MQIVLYIQLKRVFDWIRDIDNKIKNKINKTN